MDLISNFCRLFFLIKYMRIERNEDNKNFSYFLIFLIIRFLGRKKRFSFNFLIFSTSISVLTFSPLSFNILFFSSLPLSFSILIFSSLPHPFPLFPLDFLLTFSPLLPLPLFLPLFFPLPLPLSCPRPLPFLLPLYLLSSSLLSFPILPFFFFSQWPPNFLCHASAVETYLRHPMDSVSVILLNYTIARYVRINLV